MQTWTSEVAFRRGRSDRPPGSLLGRLGRGLQHRRDPLADTDAHRRGRVAALAARELERRGPGEARAARAERMPERDRAAERVQPRLVLPIDPELDATGDHLARECLVDLDEVHVLHRKPRPRERLARGGDRTEAHLVGAHTPGSGAHDSRDRHEAELAPALARRDKERGPPAVDARAVAGGAHPLVPALRAW